MFKAVRELWTCGNSSCETTGLGRKRSTLTVKGFTRFYLDLQIDSHGTGIVPHAGTILLAGTAKSISLPTALNTVLALWRKPFAAHGQPCSGPLPRNHHLAAVEVLGRRGPRCAGSHQHHPRR